MEMSWKVGTRTYSVKRIEGLAAVPPSGDIFEVAVTPVGEKDPRNLSEVDLGKAYDRFKVRLGAAGLPLDPIKMRAFANRPHVYASEGRVHLFFEKGRWKIRIDGEVLGDFAA